MTAATRIIARRAAIAAAPAAAVIAALADAGSSMQNLILITMLLGLLVVFLVAPLASYSLAGRRLRRLALAGGATYLTTTTGSLIAFGIASIVIGTNDALFAAAIAMLAGAYTLGVILGLAAIALLRSSRPTEPPRGNNGESPTSPR